MLNLKILNYIQILKAKCFQKIYLLIKKIDIKFEIKQIQVGIEI